MRAALGDIVNDDLRARDVVQRIRGMVKKSPPAYTLVDLNRVASDTVKVIQADAAAKNARIQMDLHDDLPAVRGDVVQLQQVALNLIVNALEALGTDESMPRLITVTSGRRPDGVCIWVSDTGTGIGKQQAERLFENFFTTKTDGLGLGLSISRSIVEAHRGKDGGLRKPRARRNFLFQPAGRHSRKHRLNRSRFSRRPSARAQSPKEIPRSRTVSTVSHSSGTVFIRLMLAASGT